MRVLWAATILLAVAVMQIAGGSYRTDLATHPDEAAHFVTATCLLDYFKIGFGAPPIAFAESYYAHFPKVAFGHWPPAFSAIQALWYAIVGATPASGILLVGLIAAITAFVLFARIERFYGVWTAALSVGVFFSLPVVRNSVSLLMPDLLAGVLMMLGVFTFCDGLRSGARRSWMASAFWGVAAVLTKESAFSLGFFVPVALIAIRNQTRRRLTGRAVNWQICVGFCLAVLLTLTIYEVTGVLRLRSFPAFIDLAGARARASFLLVFLRMVPWAVFAVAALGALGATVENRRAIRRCGVYELGAMLWLVVWLMSQVLFRDGTENRYFLPAILPLIMLFAAGLESVSSWIAVRMDRVIARPGWAATAAARLLAAAIAVVCVASGPADTLRHRTGYDQVAASLPAADVAPVILISSDPSGEGALIVARLVRDDAREGIVLRASKMLASSDWVGRRYRLLTSSAQEVRDLLDTIPVQFIVMDMNGFVDEGTRPHHRLLEQTMKEAPEQFQLVGSAPLVLDNRRVDGAIQIYENLKARGRHPDTVRIPMAETLGRTLELQLNQQNTVRVPAGTASRHTFTIGVGIGNLADRLSVLMPDKSSRASPRFGISPTSDTLGEEGGTGYVHVMTESSRNWGVQSSAPWVTITSGLNATGDGVVGYELTRNESNQVRRADIVIGGERYPILQRATRFVRIPFVDDFDAEPSRWVLEDHARTSTVSFDSRGPGGRTSLMLSKPAQDRELYQTQIYLPGIETEPGVGYRLSFWLKAEPPGSPWVAFNQRTQPFKNCGLWEMLTVPATWTPFVVRFTPSESGCGPDTNRLSLDVGHLSGKLWISKVSLTRE
jgi:hypothetical protein